MLKYIAILFAALAFAGAANVHVAESSESQVDLEDANIDVPELVRKYGYPLEVHDVTTDDGYILQVHRIPHGRDNNNDPTVSRPIVFLMHGLISSSADWIIMGPGRALGYILAEQGFDVWMGNARGNYYSRRHVSLNPDSGSSFWSFSWDEIGELDLAAMIDRALDTTGRPALHYIGHSQGTTAFLVLSSLKPEYNDKFKTVHLMAPVAFMQHLDSPLISSLAAYTVTLANLGTVFGLSEMFPRGSTFEYHDGEVKCIQSNPLSVMCEQFIPAFASQDSDQLDPQMFPVIFGHTPAGSSLRQFAHYGQVIDNVTFRRYNFLFAFQNRNAYGVSPAPNYDLSKITSQIKLHYSVADALTPEHDVAELNSILPRSTLRRVPIDTFTHFDFAWGTGARDAVYDDIITSMHVYEQRL